MRRSQLETKYLKTKIQTDLKLYKKHKNICSKLYKKERKTFQTVKNFGKRWDPFCLIKTQLSLRLAQKKIPLFFEDAVRLLNVEPGEYYLSDTENSSNPVEIVIRKFENHPYVQAIKRNISVNKDFYFSNTEVSDILKETTALNNKKNGTFGNIPTKLLNEVSDICVPALNDI